MQRFGLDAATQYRRREYVNDVLKYFLRQKGELYINIVFTYETASRRIAHKRSEKGRNDNKAWYFRCERGLFILFYFYFHHLRSADALIRFCWKWPHWETISYSAFNISWANMLREDVQRQPPSPHTQQESHWKNEHEWTLWVSHFVSSLMVTNFTSALALPPLLPHLPQGHWRRHCHFGPANIGWKQAPDQPQSCWHDDENILSARFFGWSEEEEVQDTTGDHFVWYLWQLNMSMQQSAVEGPSIGEDDSDGGSVSTLASKDTTRRRRGHDRKRSLFLPSSFICDLLSRTGVDDQHTHGEMCSYFRSHWLLSLSLSLSHSLTHSRARAFPKMSMYFHWQRYLSQ